MRPPTSSLSSAAVKSAGSSDVVAAPRWRGWWLAWRTQLQRWRGRGLTGRLAVLRRHDDDLSVLTADVERTFVAIGGSLQTQAELSAKLVAQGSRLLAVFSTGPGGEKPATEEAAELVRRMLSFTEENNQRIAALLDGMDAYNQQIGRLLDEERRVERIVAPLRIIQTLFRIESAVLPGDVQAAFVALSGEIPKFEEKVRLAFAQHTEALSMTRRQIEAAAVRLRDDAAGQALAVVATRSCADETLAALAKDFAAGRERDGRLEEIVRQLEHRAGEMVVSLQYQDITRQKMEHLLEVVREVGGRSAAPDLSYVHHACRLEALQARAIGGDLTQAVEGLRRGVTGVRELIGRIDRDCWPRAEFSTAAAEAGKRIEVLRDAMRAAAALMPRASAGVGEATALLDSLGGVAATVASTASAMAEDMRMIALNAQVQAAQAGEAGAGLLILAERTYLISEEIKVVTRSIGAEFAEAARQLAAAVAQGTELRRLEQRRHAEIDAVSVRVEAGLRSHEEETVTALEQLASLLEKIENEAARVENLLPVEGTLVLPLDRLHDELAAIADSLAPFARAAGLAPELAGRLEENKRRYTMDAERDVHEAAMASSGAVDLVGNARAGDRPVVVGATQPADANVELF